MSCRMPECWFPTRAKHLFCQKHYGRIDSPNRYALKSAIEKGNPEFTEKLVEGIINKLQSEEKKFLVGLKTIQTETGVKEIKEGLFE